MTKSKHPIHISACLHLQPNLLKILGKLLTSPASTFHFSSIPAPHSLTRNCNLCFSPTAWATIIRGLPFSTSLFFVPFPNQRTQKEINNSVDWNRSLNSCRFQLISSTPTDSKLSIRTFLILLIFTTTQGHGKIQYHHLT